MTGSPGGRTIPNTTLWVVLNHLEFGLEPRAAVDAPRTHHQWFPDELALEGRSWSDRMRHALLDLGHRIKVVESPGYCQHDHRRSPGGSSSSESPTAAARPLAPPATEPRGTCGPQRFM